METEIKNIREAAAYISKSLEQKKRIILYGDSDLDGASSVIILKEAIEILSPQYPSELLKAYFPDREKEGYGLNPIALSNLKIFSPALIITLDCGIGNVQEVEIAKKMGFDVIIVDHHVALSEVPKALIIVDPKQKDDKYPFKELACAGVAYKLARALLISEGKEFKPEQFLELAALATLADQMPLQEENKKIVEQGILALNYTERLGLKTLMELTGFQNEPQISLYSSSNAISMEEIRKKIIYPLNNSGLREHLNEAYLLLTENSFEAAKELVEAMIKKGELKKEKVIAIDEEVEARLKLKTEIKPIIFEGDSSWSLVLAGVVASRMCHRYEKPAFIFKIGDTETVGSVRVPKELDGVKAMDSCRELLKTYGGHPVACGFRIANENLKKFEERLIKYFSSYIS